MKPAVDDAGVTWTAVRAQGPGGQNVNKVATAVQLRFDVQASSLPEAIKARVLASGDRRVRADGVVVIRAQRFRSQERNLADALERLGELVARASDVAPPRKATRPTRASQRRRVDAKVRRGDIKVARQKVRV